LQDEVGQAQQEAVRPLEGEGQAQQEAVRQLEGADLVVVALVALEPDAAALEPDAAVPELGVAALPWAEELLQVGVVLEWLLPFLPSLRYALLF